MKKITLLALTAFSVFTGWQARAQFAESFDAGIPGTWTTLNADGGEYTWEASTLFPHTGAGHARIHWETPGAHNDFLISPSIAVTAATNDQFSFWAGINGTFWTENFEVRLSTNGGATEADFTVLLGAETATTDATIGEYTKYTYNLTPYVGTNVRVAIVATDTDRFWLYIDDVVSDALPSCIAPTDGVANVTSANTAELSWTTGGAANAEVVVQPAGTGVPADANDTGAAATGNTYSAINLDAATAYEFYVRDECVDGTDLSEWAGPFEFNTTVAPGCSSPITPADGATGVPVGEVTFEWAAPTTGDPATSYDMYYGETADDVTNFVGNFEETTALINITGYDFTFYWRIVPINAGGEATGCDGDAWMFTTESAPLPPVNDECAGAIELEPAGDFEAAAIETTNAGATYADATITSCQEDVDASVWYTVEVPASGNITIETQFVDGSPLFDTVIEAYSGACGSLTAIGCDDDGGPAGDNALFSILSLTNRTPGEIITIGVFRYGSSDGIAGAFRIGAYDSSLLATDSFNSGAFVSYPNPVQDMLNLSYTKEINDMTIYNLLGQEVFTKSLNAKTAQVDLSFLNSGNYFVKLTSGDEVKTLKVVKQ